MNNLTQIEIAYIAGLVDGEGSIFISTRGEVYFVVNMTHEDTIGWLAKKLGGNKRLQREQSDVRKRSYGVTIVGHKAKEVVKLIRPYLITKREQAELLSQYPLLRQGQHGMDDITLQLRKSIGVLMRDLNKRGPK